MLPDAKLRAINPSGRSEDKVRFTIANPLNIRVNRIDSKPLLNRNLNQF